MYGRWNDLVKSTNTLKPKKTTLVQNSAAKEPPQLDRNPKEVIKPGKSTHRDQQMEKAQVEKLIAPPDEEFGIPMSESEYESMVEQMVTCRFSRSDFDKILKTKKSLQQGHKGVQKPLYKTEENKSTP